MSTQCKETYKLLFMTELLNPFLQNPARHHKETDMKHEMAFYLKH